MGGTRDHLISMKLKAMPALRLVGLCVGLIGCCGTPSRSAIGPSLQGTFQTIHYDDPRQGVDEKLALIGFHPFGGAGNSWFEVVTYRKVNQEIVIGYQSPAADENWRMAWLFIGDVLIAEGGIIGVQ